MNQYIVHWSAYHGHGGARSASYASDRIAQRIKWITLATHSNGNIKCMLGKAEQDKYNAK